MACTHLSFLSFIISLHLLSCHGTLGSHETRRFRGESECQFERIHAVEPTRRVQSEAGLTEYWDESQRQLRCAGVAATRQTIQPKGLLLPSFSNAPRLIYVIQGKGISGVVLQGCPESFQSFQQTEQPEEHGRRERKYSGDQHQKIRRIRQGDIVALPAGVAHWFYNDGQTPVIAVTVLDTGNSANQLDQNPRKFFLAGNQPREGWHRESESTREEGRSSNNILSGFDVDLLAEAAGTSRETVEKLRGRDDRRGSIVRVENGLRVVRSRRGEEEGEESEERREEREERREEREAEEREESEERREEREERREREAEEREEREERRERREGGKNGVEEVVCNLRLKENIEEPSRADVYNPRAGRITTVNSQKLPILRYLQLSAERGSLKSNALLAPHWNINSHSIVYVIRGRARAQIVDNNGRAVFDGELRQGQLVVVPQNFPVVKKATNEEFEWVSFKTSGNAIVGPIFGKSSTFRGVPEDVLANSYQIRREEARRLKDNRGEELRILAPRSQGRAFE